MTDRPETQIDLDILAFVNGQLDAERRYAVMDHLARHPDRAAEVMADLQRTEGLKLVTAAVDAPPPATLLQAADALSTALRQQTTRRRWLPLVAGLGIFALGWAADALLQSDRPGSDISAVLETAMDAQDAVMLRASLSADLGPMPSDPDRIAARLGIDLPDMPQGWTIRAAQIVATPERPGLALIIDTADMGEILLFGVFRAEDGPEDGADGQVLATSRNGRTLAFFEREQIAFVLMDATGNPAALRAGAQTLRDRFN